MATCLTVVGLFAPPSWADLVLDTAYPIVGQRTRIHVSDDRGNVIPDAELTVICRPGSAVERSSLIGHTGDDGMFQWTPEEAGIVTITATWVGADGSEISSSTNASVKFDSTPIAGIIIMVLAGIVLLGGSVERIQSLLKTPVSD